MYVHEKGVVFKGGWLVFLGEKERFEDERFFLCWGRTELRSED